MDSDGSYMENGTITGNKCNNSGGGLDIRCNKTITIKTTAPSAVTRAVVTAAKAFIDKDMRRTTHRLQD